MRITSLLQIGFIIMKYLINQYKSDHSLLNSIRLRTG